MVADAKQQQNAQSSIITKPLLYFKLIILLIR